MKNNINKKDLTNEQGLEEIEYRPTEAFLLYIENDKVYVNMVTHDKKIQASIRDFIQEHIKPLSVDKYGMHQIFTRS